VRPLILLIAMVLAGCATVNVPQGGGKPPATVRAVGYKITVPTDPPITMEPSESAVRAFENVASKGLQVGGEALANRALDKAGEASRN
jgi:hypothetical protein